MAICNIGEVSVWDQGFGFSNCISQNFLEGFILFYFFCVLIFFILWLEIWFIGWCIGANSAQLITIRVLDEGDDIVVPNYLNCSRYWQFF